MIREIFIGSFIGSVLTLPLFGVTVSLKMTGECHD